MAKEVIHYTPKAGETFCHIAVAHGFPDCEKVRAANSNREWGNRPYLEGTELDLLIPPTEEGTDTEPDKSDTEYKLENYPPPSVCFIREQGSGYPAEPLEPGDKGYDPHYPSKDETISKLNINNYHVEWGGNGSQRKPENKFAAADFYGYHEPSSRDPDHFKVQVYDNKVPQGTDTVTVKLYAMRPIYKGKADGKEVIEFTGKHELPASDDRKLELTCKRVGKTNYFRSPYLRLVTTETDRTARPAQALLMKDYYADGKNDEEKRFSEILDQVVRAVYFVKMCKVTDDATRCQVVKEAQLTLDREVPLAVHILRGSTATDDKVREQIYNWMRRCLAPANTRPHLKMLRTVDVPKNMLTISDGNGVHASGKKSGGGDSEMVVKVDGKEIKHKPKRGDSPAKTAEALKKLLETEGFKVKGPFPVRVTGLKVKRGQVSSPQDLVIFKGDGSLAVIESAQSTDHPDTNGKLGQGLQSTRLIDINALNVMVGKDAHRDIRCVNHNYRTEHFNIYVCGDDVMSGTKACWGVGPTGTYEGWTMVADVGPCSVLCAGAMDAAQKPFNPTHEIFHPLMHVGHTDDGLPIDTASGPADRYEIMPAATSAADSVNATKHMADAPIDVSYTVFYKKSKTFCLLLNGQKQKTPVSGFLGIKKTLKDTPVERFRRIGGSYGLVVKPTDRKVDGP